MGQKSPAALLPDISVVAGGKRRGFCRLRRSDRLEAETCEDPSASNGHIEDARKAAVAMCEIGTDRGVAGADREVVDPTVLDVCVGIQVPAAEVMSIDLEIRRLRGCRPAAGQAPGEIERQGRKRRRRG